MTSSDRVGEKKTSRREYIRWVGSIVAVGAVGIVLGAVAEQLAGQKDEQTVTDPVTQTSTATSTATDTETLTNTQTLTDTQTEIDTVTNTQTQTLTDTQTQAVAITQTETQTLTDTQTETVTATANVFFLGYRLDDFPEQYGDGQFFDILDNRHAVPLGVEPGAVREDDELGRGKLGGLQREDGDPHRRRRADRRPAAGMGKRQRGHVHIPAERDTVQLVRGKS